MTSKTEYTEADLKLLKAELAQLPEKEKPMTKKDLVIGLKKDIEDLRKKGYTFEEIAQQLKKLDVVLSSTTLRTYLSEAEAAKPKRKRKSKPKVEPEQAEETKEKPGFLIPQNDDTDVYE